MADAKLVISGSFRAAVRHVSDEYGPYAVEYCRPDGEFGWSGRPAEPGDADIIIGGFEEYDYDTDGNTRISFYRVSVKIKTDEEPLIVVYEWEERSEPWYLPAPTSRVFNYSVTISYPFDFSRTIGQLPPLGTWGYCRDAEGGLCSPMRWCFFPTNKTPCWLIDPELRLDYEVDEQAQASIAVDLHGVMDGCAMSLPGAFQIGIFEAIVYVAAESQYTGITWGQLFNWNVTTENIGGPYFGTSPLEYKDESQFVGVSLLGTGMTVYHSPTSDLGPVHFSLIAAGYETEWEPSVEYLDGKPITIGRFIVPEAVPYWDEQAQEWKYPEYPDVPLGSTPLGNPEGGTLVYRGWWTLTGLGDFTGPWQTAAGQAECKEVCYVTEEGGAKRRYHGPAYIEHPGGLGQPEYPDAQQPGYGDSSYADRRMLTTWDAPETMLVEPYEIEVTSDQKDVIVWQYNQHTDWRKSDEAHFEWTDVGGKPAFKVLNAGAWLEIDYPNVNMLGARWADVIITSDSTLAYKLTISEREYQVNLPDYRIDLLGYGNDDGLTEPTQSLLDVFLPENTIPPNIPDIPWDWGVYKANTIRLEGFEVGKTYTMDRLRLVRLTNPYVLILPEAQWVGWTPNDTTRDESTEPCAFIYCGTGGTETHPCEVYAQRAGFIIVDGVVAAEIVGVLHRRTWTGECHAPDVRYAMFNDPTYAAFPAKESAFIRVTIHDVGDPGWGGIAEVPIGYLNPVYKTIGASEKLSAALRITRLNVPLCFGSVPMLAQKRYGGLALVRVADSKSYRTNRQVSMIAGCEGNYTAWTDAGGSLLTWGTELYTRTLKQFNTQYTLHEFTASVSNRPASVTWETRNRMLSIVLLRSISALAGIRYDKTTGEIHHCVAGAIERGPDET